MREILFRGKRIDNGVWEYGGLINTDDAEARIATSCLTDSDITIPLTVCAYMVDPDTVGQFTGLLDKNGNKIFEGDIVQYGERRLMVWWNDEAFQWQAKSVLGYDVITYDSQCTTNWTNIDLGWIAAEVPITGKMTTAVIGNKWDNPELLNQ